MCERPVSVSKHGARKPNITVRAQTLLSQEHCLFAAYVFLRSGWANTIFYISIFNAIVHIVMYTYYFMATFPEMRPYLWWKRFLTALQIIQFIFMVVHMFIVVTFNFCGLPSIVLYYNAAQSGLFILLFSRFYRQSYSSTSKISTENK